MATVPVLVTCLAAAVFVAFCAVALWRSRKRTAPAARAAEPAREASASEPARNARGTALRDSLDVVRPNANSVEGLEIRYSPEGLVHSVRVGAMNCEHKELLLTMDEIAWHAMPNAQKQEVLAAARGTWAAKMCPSGPDIAYVVIKTERGEIVGRASPRTVTIL